MAWNRRARPRRVTLGCLRRRLLFVFVSAIAAAAASAAACTGLLGLEPLEFVPPPSPEAAVPPVEAEAGPDSADAGSDAPKTYCAAFAAAAYCEDFDSLTDLTSLVPEASEEALKAKLTKESFISAPQAIGFSLIPDQGGFTVIKRGFATGRAVRLSFDWWVRLLGGRLNQNIQLMTLRRKNDQTIIQRICSDDLDGGFACAWNIGLARLGSDAGDKFQSFPLGARLPIEDGWTRVVYVAKFDKVDGYVKISFDGVTALEQRRLTSEETLPDTEVVSATVGLGILQGVAGPTDMLVDNIVVELL